MRTQRATLNTDTPPFPPFPVLLTRSTSACSPVSRRTISIVLAWLTTFARTQIFCPCSVHIIDPTGLVSASIKLADIEGCDTMPLAGAFMLGGISACSSCRRPKKTMSKKMQNHGRTYRERDPLSKSSRPLRADSSERSDSEFSSSVHGQCRSWRVNPLRLLLLKEEERAAQGSGLRTKAIRKRARGCIVAWLTKKKSGTPAHGEISVESGI